MLVQPINFIAKYKFSGVDVFYKDLNEVVQGGPEIGYLYLNNENVFPKLRFGGPLYFFDNKIYVPKYVGSGFILTSINIVSKQIISYGSIEPLILLFKVDNESANYYVDLKNNKAKTIKVNYIK